MIDMTAADEISGDARARSNVMRLAAAQALTGANSAVIFATGSIVGATLAPSISFATVPLSMYVVGLAAGTLPTGAISRAYGRRVAFIIGTGCGMLRDLARRPLWRGLAILSFRRGRRRQRGISCEGGVVGDGRRRVRRRARPAARAVDDGYLAAIPVCLQLRDAGDGCSDRDGRTGRRRRPKTCAIGSSRRPSAARDRAAAAVHRGRVLRYRVLSHDESGDDLRAAGDENVRPERERFEFRHSVAYRGDVRAELLYRHADRALRHHRLAFLGHAHGARAGVEFQLCRCFRAGAGDAPAAGAQQGAGLQRFSGVRDDGGGLVLVGPVAGELRLVGGQYGGVSAGAVGARGAGGGVVCKAARRAAAGCGISRSGHLI